MYRTIKSPTQIYCRWCAKPIKKATESHRTPCDAGFVANDESPRTPEDLAKLTNEKVVSWSYAGESKPETKFIWTYSTWDGESYKTRFSRFCTTTCAGLWAEKYS